MHNLVLYDPLLNLLFVPQENPFESPSKQAQPGAPGNASVPTSPVRSRADELEIAGQSLLGLAEYVRKLERKIVAQEKSLEIKTALNKTLETQNRE